MKIKNIIFDVDGVLINRDLAFANFLRQFPKYSNMTNEDIYKFKKDVIGNYDIDTFGKRFEDSEFYMKRPVFNGVMEILQILKNSGLRLFTLSASGNPEKKLPVLKGYFGDLLEYEFSPMESKKEAIKNILIKYNLKEKETLFIDDSELFLREGLESGVNIAHSEIIFYASLSKDLSNVPVIKKFSDVLGLV